MAQTVTETFRPTLYSGGAVNTAYLTVGGIQIPNENIKSIKVSSPIIDNASSIFSIGTFISQKIEVEFLNAVAIDLSAKVYLELGTLIDGEYEMHPIGYFNIETSPEDYYNNCKIVALDNAVLFKPNIDISDFFDEETNSITIENLLIALSNYYLGEGNLGTYPDVNNDVVISTYDNTLSGKAYISYIAELMGGNAKIGRDGKLYIKSLKQTPTITIDALQSKSFVTNGSFTLSRVKFEDGIRSFEMGEDSDNTLRVRSDNPFIVGTFEEAMAIIENIYNALVGVVIWNVKTENYGDYSLDCWDLITYTINTNNYVTLNNNELTYQMNISSIVETVIPSKNAEEYVNDLGKVEDKIRTIKTEIDSVNNELTIVAQQTEGNSQNITTLTENVNGVVVKVEEIDGIKDDVAEISAKVDGLEVNVVSSGGNNLIQNSVGLFTGDWDVSHESYTDTEIKNNTISKSAWLLQNLTSEQVIQVQNGIYTISGKYKKLISLSDCKLIVNGNEIELTALDFDTFTYTFEVLSNTITIDIISDTDDSCYLTDLMLNVGSLAQVWTPANGESIKGNVKIGNVIIVSSDTSNTRTIMDTDGNRIENASTGEVIAEYTDKGMSTKDIEAESGTIANLLIIDVGDQTWLSRL